jgi:Ser/Thr protein kinase RdoA (MazF antagonist)
MRQPHEGAAIPCAPGNMTISLESIPSFTGTEALAVAEREFGIVGKFSALPSERDQNFLITDACGGKFVLKIANLNDAPDLLDFQNQAMRHVEIAQTDCRVQRVIPTRQGSYLTNIHNARTGTDHCVRVLTWIDGEVLAKSTLRGPALFESIGTSMAKVDAALCGFTHPAMHRVLQWDLRQAGMARENAALLSYDRRVRVERIFSKWERIDWTALRHSVIHGDANDYNVIVAAGRMVGLLDFGDIVHTATVCDLAVALAYTMLNEKEPLLVAAQVIGAYQRFYPLSEAERQVLFPLILSRLGMSVCYSAHNRARNPNDPYQVVTEAAAWELLDRLELRPADDALASMTARPQ